MKTISKLIVGLLVACLFSCKSKTNPRVGIYYGIGDKFAYIDLVSDSEGNLALEGNNQQIHWLNRWRGKYKIENGIINFVLEGNQEMSCRISNDTIITNGSANIVFVKSKVVEPMSIYGRYYYYGDDTSTYIELRPHNTFRIYPNDVDSHDTVGIYYILNNEVRLFTLGWQRSMKIGCDTFYDVNGGDNTFIKIESSKLASVVASKKFLDFCKEVWKDKDYNPAKFKVKSKAFSNALISLYSFPIVSISSNEKENEITLCFARKKENVDWLNTKTRMIVAYVKFDKAEAIMNLNKGDDVSVKAVFDNADDIYEAMTDVKTYSFHFSHATIIKNE